ncbi:MAG: GNAT family N-acetyltransferase, partial [Theionarchaea archaeon]|nr:GNAT family N-acetyltransferase [Theionarchaea archaeon]
RLQGIPLEGLVIAEMDGEYAGFLYWFMGENPWFDTGTEKFAYINEIHVVKEYQRQGIGRKLLNYTLEQLKEKNIGPTYISTTERNIVARHLYEDAGFREFSRSIHYKLE